MLLLFIISTTGFAVTVHTWVDDDGVRHYADAPPSTAKAESAAIELDDRRITDSDAEDDFYSINNQWARVRAERELDAEQKIERERIRAEERAARQQAQRSSEPNRTRSFNSYFPYGGPF